MPTHTTDIYRKKIEDDPQRPNRAERVEKEHRVERTISDSEAPRVSRAYHHATTAASSRVVYYLLDLLEIILAFRLVFLMIGASTLNAFVRFIYGFTNPLVAPFRGIVPATSSQGVLIDWSTIIAMIVYAIIGYIIARIVFLVENA